MIYLSELEYKVFELAKSGEEQENRYLTKLESCQKQVGCLNLSRVTNSVHKFFSRINKVFLSYFWNLFSKSLTLIASRLIKLLLPAPAIRTVDNRVANY